ncbi:MAG: TRAP transporter large permease subunit [Myxococcota bacterium]
MTSVLAAIARVVRLVDFLTADLVQQIRRRLTSALSGPLLEVVMALVIGVTGIIVILERVAGVLDRAMGFIERAFVAIALLAMTALAFNAYLAEELRNSFNAAVSWDTAQDFFGLWAIDGQLNVALLLMVVVGFLGASLATQEGKHIAVDAAERVLSPSGARFLRRFTSLVAAGLCLLLARGSYDAMLTHTQDTFEGAQVWSPFVAPVNGLTSLMPGDKFGPVSCKGLDDAARSAKGCPDAEFATGDDWINGMYDRGLDPFDTEFEDAKVAFVNPGGSPIDVKVVAAGSGNEAEAPTPWEPNVPANGSTMFESVSLEHGATATVTWNNQSQTVRLQPNRVHRVTVGASSLSVEAQPLIAFGFVDTGDDFPLWIPYGFLVVAFFVMAVRFGGRVFSPGRDLDDAPPLRGSRSPADVLLAGAVPGAIIAIGLGVWLGQGWIIGISSLLLVVLGSPLFVGIGVGTVASWVLLRDGSAESVIADMFEAVKKEELLAIPFFVLAGNLMTKGSIAERLIDLAKAVLGPLPGGLGAGAVLACATFAAISGSSPVTVIAIGTIMFPMLLKEGYSERYSMGVLTTAGGLGVIIPPSIPMIVYAIMVSGNKDVGVVTPTDLFRAGLLPGIFIALVLIGYTMFIHWPRPDEVNEHSGTEWSFGEWGRELLRAVWKGLPSLMLPVLILGGLYNWLDFGFFAIRFNVTTAAAVAVVYALFVEMFIHRELQWRKLPGVFSESAVMMGSLFLILVIAISLNKFFVFEEVPQAAAEWMLARVQTPFGFLVMVNLFLLALGCVMDILSAILIVAPLLAPIATGVYGIDPIAFGIMFIVNLELGYLTPPMGINLFVASTTFERSIIDVIRGVVPFLLLMLFCLVCIVAYVWLTSGVPAS